MTRLGIGLVIGVASLVGASVGTAQVTYDNPRIGEAPCIVVTKYEATAQQARAAVDNICQRAVEIRFCFQYLGTDGAMGQECFVGPVRGGESALATTTVSAARFTGPSYEWRFFE